MRKKTVLLKIFEDNPHGRKINQVVKSLQEDGVIIYPSDTIYGLGCSIYSKKAMEEICIMRNIDPSKARFSIICKDISEMAEYCTPIPNSHYKLIKRLTPGPYTFILNASKDLPKVFVNRKKTIGIRIQQSKIVEAILQELGSPILSATLRNEDEITEYYNDPQEIFDNFQGQVDFIIDAGLGGLEASTVIDLTESEPQILRDGKGTDIL